MIITKLFLSFFEVSLSTTLIVFLLMLAAPLLNKRYLAKWKCWIWLFLAVRLILPVNGDSITHAADMWTNTASTISEVAMMGGSPADNAPTTGKTSTAGEALTTGKAPTAGEALTTGKTSTAGAASTTEESSTTGETSASGVMTNGTLLTNGKSSTGGFLSENDMLEKWHPEDGGAAPKQETQLFQRVLLKVPESMTTPLVLLSGEDGRKITLLDIIAVVWLTVCLMLFFLYLFSYKRCRGRILREGRVLEDSRTLDLLHQLSQELHIKRTALVMLYEEAASPMVIGFLKPILVLSGKQYSEEDLYFILKHELIHLKRYDVIFKLLLAVVSTLHWFNPVAWIMQREAAVDMELSCDERVVLGAGYKVRRAYTETIMRALHKKTTTRVILSTQFYEGKSIMKKRFTNILLWTGKKNGSAILGCVVVLTVSLGALIGCSTANTGEASVKKLAGEPRLPEGEDMALSEGEDMALSEGEDMARPEGEDMARPEGEDTALSEGEDTALSDSQEIPMENKDTEDVVQNTDEVKVLDEIKDGEIRYQTRPDGIYCLEGDNEERIYDNYAGRDTQLSLFEGRLYFKTDHMYEAGASNWQDTAIRWIDLQTLETGDLQMVREGGVIKSFSIYRGIVTIRYTYPNNALESHMLYVGEDAAWNGKKISELSKAEKRQYGQSLTQTVLQEQDTLTNVSNRVQNQNLTYLDMDGDGVTEEILLEPSRNAGEVAPDEPLRYYRLRIGEAVVETYGYNTDNTLWAFSLDGETLLLALYEDGPSADPLTHFYQYRNGRIVEVGSFETDIRSCRLEQGGVLSGAVFREIVNSDWIRINWRMGEDGRLEEAPQEYYEFIRGNWVELREELPLHLEAGSGEVFTVAPQLVKFLQTSADWSWLLLETEDGQQGWVHVVDHQVEELDKHVMDVFQGGYLAG